MAIVQHIVRATSKDVVVRGGSDPALFENPSGAVREQASSALAAQPALIALLRKQYGRKACMVRIV